MSTKIYLNTGVQDLTEEQAAIVRTNIGAVSFEEVENTVSTIQTNNKLDRLSDGHFYSIDPAHDHTMTTYELVDDTIVEKSTLMGSDYIACPKYLGIYFPDSAARAYVYFYDLVDGEYVPRWDIIDKTTSSNVKNYLNPTNTAPYLFEIPDGVYMQIRKAVGEVEFYGWDGEAFGMPLSADYSFPKYDGTVGAFNTDGSYGTTIPGDAKYAIAHDGCEIWVVNGYVGDSATSVYDSTARSFIKLPEGYDFFRARIVPTENGTAVAKSRSGDMSGLISIVVDNEAEIPSEKALRVLENCKNICDLKWTPKLDVPIKSSSVRNFAAGVEYMGIPYGSQWQVPHYIGWHVSPHTFVNAINDEASIFYVETVSRGAPYYSLVCSALATMCEGWPYPQTNYGFLYDPMVDVKHASSPVIGELFAHLDDEGSHVVIPERIDHLDNDIAVSVYEAVTPVTQRTTRYGKVSAAETIDVYHASYGSDRYDLYGYVAHHWLANPDMSVNVPYINLDDVEIVGGSARPYKGDKCVYTSEEAVLINIKDTAATTLYIMKDGEATQSIAINGATQVDVTAYLSGDGIYYVYTDTDATQESFEYHVVEAIQCYIKSNGVPVLGSTDFWYVMFRMSGDFRHGADVPTSQMPAEDYSYLIENGAVCNSIHSVYRKGTYGAYCVPFEVVEAPKEDAVEQKTQVQIITWEADD